MIGVDQIEVELSTFQRELITEVDALVGSLSPNVVNVERSGIFLAPPGQQHAPIDPRTPTIQYVLFPIAASAAHFELFIGADSAVVGIGAGSFFYWEVNSTSGEFSEPHLKSVVPLCQAVIDGKLRESARYRSFRCLSQRAELEVPGLDKPLCTSWLFPWTYPMLWLGPIRGEARQYARWIS